MASNAATPSHEAVAAEEGATVPEPDTITRFPPVMDADAERVIASPSS
jgi:hypothetical protein